MAKLTPLRRRASRSLKALIASRSVVLEGLAVVTIVAAAAAATRLVWTDVEEAAKTGNRLAFNDWQISAAKTPQCGPSHSQNDPVTVLGMFHFASNHPDALAAWLEENRPAIAAAGERTGADDHPLVFLSLEHPLSMEERFWLRDNTDESVAGESRYTARNVFSFSVIPLAGVDLFFQIGRAHV